MSQDSVHRRVDTWQHASIATSVVVGAVTLAVCLILADFRQKLFYHFAEVVDQIRFVPAQLLAAVVMILGPELAPMPFLGTVLAAVVLEHG